MRGLLVLVVACVAACNGGRGPAQTLGERSEPVSVQWWVGTGSANHDPQSPVCVGGGASFCGRMVDPEVPGAVADELLARAMVVSDTQDRHFMLISTTNIGYFLAYKAGEGAGQGIYDMRLRIAEATGMDSRHIVVVSDHSHNGPDTVGIWGGVSPDYKAITADAVVAAGIQAWQSRQPAVLRVAAINSNDSPLDGVPRLESSYNSAPGLDPDQGNPSNQFRMLVADHADSGERLLTLVNYAPHATVINGVATDKLSGDWAAWAPQEAQALFGGFGLAAVGSVGATDWNKSGGDAAEREAEARARLRLLMSAAQDQLQAVRGQGIQLESVFIRELITQPVLLLNYKPRLPSNQDGSALQHYDIRIDRALTPPFLQGALFGTYVTAVRIGELFFSTFPGEPFGELEAALRERVRDPQAHFLLGAANDFFGYMTFRDETYWQTFSTGATWLLGCPEQDLVYDPLGLDYDGACTDHWSLMVSPTIGQHIVCTLHSAALELGFDVDEADARCAALTALDGLAPPAESTASSANPTITQEQCEARGAPQSWCKTLD
ncbi:MAG: hypothetical protein EVA65_05910 [Oceanococcus sp.]|nr:MAG: hypothetical protein EVA65_05910 [Oceanococcus sp.]